jgi:hypothetical protein
MAVPTLSVIWLQKCPRSYLILSWILEVLYLPLADEPGAMSARGLLQWSTTYWSMSDLMGLQTRQAQRHPGAVARPQSSAVFNVQLMR